ncbi:hypothetical protein FY136_28820 (plasmid) [Agrobacterium tumefaciens]|uniref:hypothetical protein n=1 Tax=Agrobacterium tumefaciens TaxID=358 RepID=UPI0021CF003F|nr:hypothetical protein [Agrobacterium tumefaciens]UXT53267.1 hypothetical protein FY136_28820 [Agrobacterium tumefaciens]
MLLKKLRENWHEIRKIGIEAEERGKALGLTPSWAKRDNAPIQTPPTTSIDHPAQETVRKIRTR